MTVLVELNGIKTNPLDICFIIKVLRSAQTWTHMYCLTIDGTKK